MKTGQSNAPDDLAMFDGEDQVWMGLHTVRHGKVHLRIGMKAVCKCVPRPKHQKFAAGAVAKKKYVHIV